MNNDIVVKQKPAASTMEVKQPPQPPGIVETQPATPEADTQKETPAQQKAPTNEPAEVSKKSNKPTGIIFIAIIIAICLVTIAIYIGYNQSQAI